MGQRIRRIGVGSAAKMLGALYGGIGLLAGAVFSLISVMGASLGGRDSAGLGLLFGAGAIVFVPLIYGVLGVIAGALMSLLYNAVATFAGGIEIELE